MRTYDLEPLVRGNSYPAWDLDATMNELPMGMQRIELLVRDSGNQVVYSWDSAGDSPNVEIDGGIATFAAIDAEITQGFRTGRHHAHRRVRPDRRAGDRRHQCRGQRHRYRHHPLPQ